jgi:hypothetical protein
MTRRSRYPPSAPEPLRAILARAGENRFARTREAIPAALWRDAVGARIAERAVPISLEGGVLLLRVPSSVWASELSLLSDDVCARLGERGVKARELRFRVGTLPPVERPAERRVTRSVPHVREVPDEVARVLASVEDAELRGVIARAAAANLAWQTVVRPAPPAVDGRFSEAQRAARAPRSVAGETARPDQTSPASPADPRDTRAGGRDRSH